MKWLIGYLFMVTAAFAYGQDWTTTVRTARNAYKNGDFERSIRLYQSVEKQSPKTKKLSSEFGQAAYRSGDFVSAQTYFENASKQPNKKQAANQFHNLGNSYMKQKKYGEAIAAYKKALRLYPNDKQTQYNLSEALRNNNKSNNSSSNQQKNQTPSQPKNEPSKPQPQSQDRDGDQKLPSKSADRLLNQLMKAEAETKRKIAGSRQKGTGNSSGKDW